MKLEDFIAVFSEEIDNQSENTSNSEQFFVEKMGEYLSENGIITDIELSFGQKLGQGLKVNAYSYHEEQETLSIFIAEYNRYKFGKTISKTNVEKTLRRVVKYYSKSISGMKNEMEETAEDYPLAQLIFQQHGKTIKSVEFFLVTNYLYKANERIILPELRGVKANYHIWDIERLYQLINENQGLDNIEINFEVKFGKTFELLKVPNNENAHFDCYMGFIPADLLAMSYEMWGERLVERNVRSFLQARGNVNRGIRDTLRKNKEMFVAYNNGVSTVADDAVLELVSEDSNLFKVKEFKGWQIVNGGQTTASVFHALKEGIDLSDVFIQLKLTVVQSDIGMYNMTAKISEYANTQNKISMSDLKANHPSLINLEAISRTTWIPSNVGTKSNSKWFFERARGQYLVEVNRQTTLAKKKAFQKENPKNKVLSKTNIAKYYMSWNQCPHIVSKGGETNFEAFISLLDEKGIVVDSVFFKEIVAKGILFNTCDKIIKELDLPGYKANIITYTISMLSCIYKRKMDFVEIWEQQSVSLELQNNLRLIATYTWNHITNPPIAGTNVTQWCKRKECWERFVDEHYLEIEKYIRSSSLI
ncbi:AIPR family protein [Bacillus pumilus]|uniref:AIPR family protein n=1 Tax=Bacillus TaxID=1386 RepID=UPI001B819208|nr:MULTISPECIES: AIPR family protein [Bacillus]MBR0622217.1 AIPR family protein [Bacillus pumilus]MCW6700197.1 AIPR family protein [Bacillus sp. RP12]